ncbi:MAG: hypothetical protein ACI4SK_01925 [Christensenellales bacterium]
MEIRKSGFFNNCVVLLKNVGRVFKELFFLSALVFFTATVFLAALFGQTENCAYGADAPYVTVGKDVWLMDIDTGRRIFLLPETYYAVIDNIDAEYYYVTFNGVSGKVYKESVSVTGYHTTAPGTVQEIKIAAQYQVFTEIKLKSTLEGKGEDVLVPTDASMYFLGKYPSDELWYYVRYNENCGYIKAEYTSNPDLQTGVFTPEGPSPSEPLPEEPQNGGNLVKILVITGVCVAVAAVLIILFIPKKKGKGRYYYEDTEL